MPSYVSAQYGDRRRYLLKALREIAHRIEQVVASLDEHVLSARSDDPELDEDWSIREIVGYLRDSEREDVRAVEAMLERDRTRIDERQAQYGPAEHDYRSVPVDELLWDFMMLRDELLWALRSAGPAWEHRGRHPYRGDVSVLEWVQEMNERDLDVLWRIQRLSDRLSSGGAGGRERRSPDL